MSREVRAPFSGRIRPLTEVPDPVFAEAMVGPGLAIDPDPGEQDVVSPVDGEITTLHPHAFVVGGILVHLGIDTVKLEGEGFTLLAKQGDTVACGQPLVRWDPAAVEVPVCPVIALDAGRLLDPAEGRVEAGDPLFTVDRPPAG